MANVTAARIIAGMRSVAVIFFATAVAFSVVGCAAPPRATGPTRAVVRVSDRDAFIDGIMTVLREHDFPPDELDRRGGLLVTAPSTSGQWFEIWRRDVHGAYQLLESSIHTMRRTVTVRLHPVPSEAESAYELDVSVRKERLSAPERQITTASGALAIYSERVPTMAGLRGPAAGRVRWIDLGRDVLLERYLLDRFSEAAGLVRRVEASENAPQQSSPPATRPQPTAPGELHLQSSST
ncbi:MAG: hypothetical protein D6744_17890 [Planctomycetota bacterium]|nr:MAG: hypothetical protein D6744_17890 [Planctomycetota bacterium]